MKEKLPQLEKIIRSYLRKNKIPGLAISIFREDSIIYSKGFGARDLEEFLPMTPKTLIGIGSISKSFTAFGIMKLVERNLISLEDSASKYLDFPPFNLHPEMKIKHMMSHSTGVSAAESSLPSLFYTLGDYKRVYPATTREDFITHLGEPEDFIIFKPGEKFFYNNDMFTCLSFIIEQISGQKFVEFVRDEILKPLEMKRAVFTKDEFEKDTLNDKMTGYLSKKEGDTMVPKKNQLPFYDYLCASGGLYVSMEEMMNYAKCLLQKGEYNGNQLLSPKSIEEMWTPRIATPFGYGENPQYCLGWVKDEGYFPFTMIHHAGGLGTSCAIFILIPEQKIAVVVAQNACTGDSANIALAALSLLLDKDPFEQVKDLKLEKIIEEISGLYKSAHDLFQMKINQKGLILMAEFELPINSMSFPLRIDPSNFDKLDFKICTPLPMKEGIKFIRNPETEKVQFATYGRFLFRKK